jgi:hypothetical protein
MSVYGVALMPLASRMRETVPDALQPWYCDNAGSAGTALPNAHFLYFLVKFGPQYGYFPALGHLHLPSLLPSQRHVVGAAKRGVLPATRWGYSPIAGRLFCFFIKIIKIIYNKGIFTCIVRHHRVLGFRRGFHLGALGR